MSFVNLSLTLGGLLVSVPILLHLLLRQKPKQLVFPAIRFIQQRKETNQRTLQLRHWILLALRCLSILIVAATLARPRVASASFGNWLVVGGIGFALLVALTLAALSALQHRSRTIIAALSAVALALGIALAVMLFGTLSKDKGVMIGSQQAPIAVVLVFDTSPRMLYRQDNTTRLAQAQEMAHWLLRQLPPDSEVAVVESRPSLPSADGEAFLPGFARDVAAAEKSIKRLKSTGTPRDLADVLEESHRIIEQTDLDRREIYLFTDLTTAAWKLDQSQRLRQLVDEQPTDSFYIIDVGAENPQNFAVRDLRLSSESLAKNSPLEIEVEVSHSGSGGERKAELLIEQTDGSGPILRDGKLITPPTQPRGREIISLPEDGSQLLRFSLRGLPEGVHHGRVRIEGQDGLSVDDERHFTIEVRDAWPVLVVAPDKVNTLLLTEALANFEERANEGETFVCKTVRQSDLANQNLLSFAAVCLVDPKPLPPDQWQRLENYVNGGGSVAIMLGHNAVPQTSFNSEDAQAILPGQLVRQTRAGGRDLYLAPSRYDHPILTGFRSIPRESIPWNLFPVFKHWDLGQVTPDSQIVVRFGNQQPAIVAREVGSGRVVVVTTPLTELLRPPAWKAWNELAGESDWPRFLIVNDMMRYLVERTGESRLNYLAGELATLPNDDARHPQRYQLYTPLAEPEDVIARDGRITVRFTESPGAYRLKGNRGATIVRGFAVNLHPEASDLNRMTTEEVTELLGEENFQLARSRDEIEIDVRETRIGREFYPFLLLMLTMIVGIEQLFSNRFYKQDE